MRWGGEARLRLRICDTGVSLARLLQLRFTPSLPEDLTVAVAAMADGDELSRWFDAAATAGSLEAFRVAVRR